MTYATRISQNVKDAVSARDRGICVLCGRPGHPNAHVVRRSQGGMGIEQNIVTLCHECHKQYDEGKLEERRRDYVRLVAHLKGFYPEWNREDMIYKKWRPW